MRKQQEKQQQEDKELVKLIKREVLVLESLLGRLDLTFLSMFQGLKIETKMKTRLKMT